MVQIFKETESKSRTKPPKVEQIAEKEYYKEAHEYIEELKTKNKNPRINYYAGNIY